MTNPEPMELLSAFLDGEEVEPTALAEALTTPGARETLRDFALLRAGIQDDDEAPGAEAYRSIRGQLAAAERVSWWRRAIPVPVPAVAASVVLALALAFWAGASFRPVATAEVEEPPTPDRVVRYQPGVDWHEIENAALRP